MASWPSLPGRRQRGVPSDRVRCLADAAMRRSVRRAVLGGLPFLAFLIALDDVQSLLRGNLAAPGTTAVDLAVLAIDAALFVGLRIGRIRAEAVALLALLLSVASSVLTMRLDPSAVPLSSAYLATMLAASGLFLPWSPRWQATWVVAALVMLLAADVGLPARGGMPIGLFSALAICALASVVGQRLVFGRVRRMTEQQFELRLLSRYASRQDDRLLELNVELLNSARTDSLTGLGNRRALDEALRRLAGRRLAAVLLDLDQFKAFNDRNGHLAGDVALQQIGRVLREQIRGDDLAFRYGGEEFLILVPGGEVEPAAALAERVRAAVEQDEGPMGGELTISAGVAVADRFSAADPLPLLRRADAALYQAKRRGRNRVVVDGEPIRARTGSAFVS